MSPAGSMPQPMPAPLSRSLLERTRQADAAWIHRLAWGALAIALAVPAYGLGALVMSLAAPRAGSLFHFVGAGLTLAGVWLLTAPKDRDDQPHAWLATAARACSAAAALLWLGSLITAGTLGIGPALACMAGVAVALGLYAGELAQRLPGDELAAQFHHLVRLLPVFFAFLIICRLYDLPRYFDAYFFFAFPLLGALVGLALWVAVTFVRFSLELRHTTEDEVEPWQLEPTLAPDVAAVASVWTADEIRGLARPLLHGWLMIGLGLMLVGAAIRDYRLVLAWDFLRTPVVVAELAAGAGIAFCFGAAMHYLDAALDFRRASGRPLAWRWRTLLVLQKRLLMVGQLAGAALVVGILGLLIFNEPLPVLGS